MSKYLCALAVLAAMSIPPDAAAQDEIWNRYTLEDLGGVFVRTETDEPCESVGVTRRDVQADAEAILLESEVELLTEGEMLRNPAMLCILQQKYNFQNSLLMQILMQRYHPLRC